MKIEVTQRDIDYGVQGECHLCPIALAFKRSSNFKRVYVNSKSIEVLQTGKAVKSYELPKKAQTFVRRFDRQESVKPFSFELENL
jgi:hypothetical protein